MILSLLVTMAMLAFYDKHKTFVTSISTWLDDDLLMFLCPLLNHQLPWSSKILVWLKRAENRSYFVQSISPSIFIYRERQKLWSFCGFIKCKDSNRIFLTTLVHVHCINYENAWLYFALCSSVLFYEFRGRCSTLYIFLFHSLYPPYK